MDAIQYDCSRWTMFTTHDFKHVNLFGQLLSRYALLGAASFLQASMRLIVSLCVIMIEITNTLKLLPSIMLVLLKSKVYFH